MNKRCFKKIFLTRYLKPPKIEKEVTIMEDKIMTIINQITHEKRYEDANGLLISENIKIARNTVNMSLNQLYKKGLFIKIN